MTDTAFSSEYAAGFAKTVQQARRSGISDPENWAQQAWAQAWEKREQYRGEASFQTWVYRILFNGILGERRRQASRPVIFVDEPPAPSITSSVAATIDAWSLLKKVSADQRRALVLFHLADMTLEEMADMTGESVGAIKSRLFRGRLAAAAAAQIRIQATINDRGYLRAG